MTDPTKAIDGLEELRRELNQRFARLGWEIETAQEQWAGLGNVGGQRADHAAKLLAPLRFHLEDISSFTAQVSAQITAMVADPFERTKAA